MFGLEVPKSILPPMVELNPEAETAWRIDPIQAASAIVEIVSIGTRAPATLLTNIAANGATAFLVILAMTFGLILPRMLLEDRSWHGTRRRIGKPKSYPGRARALSSSASLCRCFPRSSSARRF
jgi:hypothetical protein